MKTPEEIIEALAAQSDTFDPTNPKEQLLRADVVETLKVLSHQTGETVESLKVTLYKRWIKNQRIINNIPVTDEEKIKSIRQEVIQHLALKERRDATEKLAKFIEGNNYIYTTRQDERSEMWIYQDGIYVPQGKTYIREICRIILDKTYTGHLINEVIEKVEADTFIDTDLFFNHVYVDEVCCENGILNLKDRTLSPFTNKKIFFNKIPVKYQPSVDCPVIKKHLNEVLKHEEDVQVIQELFGYCLYKEYKIEKAFMLVGDGRNGKGKTLEILRRFVGIENCTNISPKQFETNPYAMSELFNKMVNIAADISAQALKETGPFKSVTGRDMISAPRKYLNQINFVNYAKMIFSANQIPRTYDEKTAFFNRWIILEFPYTFIPQKELDKLDDKDSESYKVADPDVVAKLTTPQELSGLLNWALEGLTRLLENNSFSYSKSTDEVQTMWSRKSNSFVAFFEDCINRNVSSNVPKSELRKQYANYCEFFKLPVMSDKAIAHEMSKNGVSEERIRTDDEGGERVDYRVWQEISLDVSFLNGSDTQTKLDV